MNCTIMQSLCVCLFQVVTNRDTQETLLCMACVFEVSNSEHGAQHHIYRLVKEWSSSFTQTLDLSTVAVPLAQHTQDEFTSHLGDAYNYIYIYIYIFFINMCLTFNCSCELRYSCIMFYYRKECQRMPNQHSFVDYTYKVTVSFNLEVRLS